MQSQVIQGTLKPDGSLELAEKPQLAAGPVEITIRAVAAPQPGGENWFACLQRIRKELEEIGYPFMNEEETNAYIEDMRSGDERIDEVYHQMEEERRKAEPS
jgi:hypothetical protein